MSTMTITSWQTQEKNSFENFNEFIATRLEDGIFRSLAEKMRLDIQANHASSVTLPWGTYTAEVKSNGDAGNITPAWEPSKILMAQLNRDDHEDEEEDLHQDTFDPEYVQLFRDYVAYGHLYPDKIGQDAPAREKGLKLTDDEVEYFLNSYGTMLAGIGRDKQRAGKSYRLEINEAFPHGSFDFEYPDDETIKVKFVPHKVFKQYLKDDEVATAGAVANFTPVYEGTRVEKFPKKNAAEKSSKKSASDRHETFK